VLVVGVHPDAISYHPASTARIRQQQPGGLSQQAAMVSLLNVSHAPRQALSRVARASAGRCTSGTAKLPIRYIRSNVWSI
jgi:hypothetical protein